MKILFFYLPTDETDMFNIINGPAPQPGINIIPGAGAFVFLNVKDDNDNLHSLPYTVMLYNHILKFLTGKSNKLKIYILFFLFNLFYFFHF